MQNLQEIMTTVEKGKGKLIESQIEKSLADGIEPENILEAMIQAMDNVGDRFSKDEIFMPEMLVAAKAMKKGVEVLKPVLSTETEAVKVKCVIGTVEGDIHDIGKNLVGMMLESAGFEVVDLGVDVPKEKFMEQGKDADLICCSALLTNTMPALQETVSFLKNAFRKKVMVGGAPITADFADQIGADGYAADAAGAVTRAKELLEL